MLKKSYYASLSPEKRKEYNRKANNSPKAKQRRQKYWSSPKGKTFAANAAYKRNYGLTVEDIEKMFVRQDGKCPICEAEFSNRRQMHVDHSHETGKIRQLLCGKCNVGIAMFRETPELLFKAVTYLERWSQPPL